MLRTGKWRTDWPGRFGRVTPKQQQHQNADQKTILIHAVSLGEVNATRHLISLLQEQHPNLNIVLATTTNTGYNRATELFADTLTVARYPFDFSFAVNRFLSKLKPDIVALMELEVWPNFLKICHKRNIPVVVLNGRLTARSYSRYKLALPFVKPTFKRITAVAAQTPDYAERFAGLGVPQNKIHILDTMKWDTAQPGPDIKPENNTVPGSDEIATSFNLDLNRPTIVAGSTGPGEEQLIVTALKNLDINLIIVPRKPERFDEVATIDPACIRRSVVKNQSSTHTKLTGSTRGATPPFFLLDTLGELRKAYALADLVIVGRSFNGWGGSDPIEPIALGKPVIIGPDTHNFANAVAAFKQAQGILICKPDNLTQTVQELLQNPAHRSTLAQNGQSVIHSRQGSTQKHIDLILKNLPST